VLLSGALACGGSDATGPGDPVAEARAQVYAGINELRATESLPPLTPWKEAEACASDQAGTDAGVGTAHSAFGRCGESAQNECLGYPSVSYIPTACLQAMWNEGPGDFATHGHYVNMTNTRYTKVAVGFHVTDSGSVWAVMDFSP
jgi:Cysteine-rich secretory protein family